MKDIKVIGVVFGIILLTVLAYFFITKVLPFLVFTFFLFIGCRWLYKKMNDKEENTDTTETKS